MKTVILIEHSPLYKTAKAISSLPCCLKQWILTNHQKLNVNENVPEPVAEYNTNLLIVTYVAFKDGPFYAPEIIKCLHQIVTIFSNISFQKVLVKQTLRPSWDELPASLINQPHLSRRLLGLDIPVYLLQCAFLHRFKFMHCWLLFRFSSTHLYSPILIMTLKEFERT